MKRSAVSNRPRGRCGPALPPRPPAFDPSLTAHRPCVKEAAVSAACTRTLVALALVVCAAPPVTAAPTQGQIARWVRQLGDEDFAVREEATKRLWAAGQAAEAALEAAVKS